MLRINDSSTVHDGIEPSELSKALIHHSVNLIGTRYVTLNCCSGIGGQLCFHVTQSNAIGI
jgi:hypothetical protein